MSSTRAYMAREDRRDVLLDAAAEVLREGGPDALSLRSVAECAGVAHRLVSYTFGSKTELVRALLVRDTTDAIDAAWGAPLEGSDAQEAIIRSLTAFADAVRSDPRYSECLAALTATARLSPELADAVSSEARHARSRIRAHVSEWAASHPHTPVDVDVLTDGIHASAEGLAAWWLATRDDARLADVVRGFAIGIVGAQPS